MASRGRGCESTSTAMRYVPQSRTHRFNVIKGKSDHVTLTSAKKRNNATAELRATSPDQSSRRVAKTKAARHISIRKKARSRPLPSMKAPAAVIGVKPSHCAGSRDAIKNIQVTGIQSASEGVAFLRESY